MKTNNNELLKKSNKIAYDTPLRKRLKELHDFLATDVTDVAVGAGNYALQFSIYSKNVLKVMSKLDADLTVALINATEGKKMSKEEEGDYKLIQGLAEMIGNLQFKINTIINKSEKFNKLSQELAEESFGTSDIIMDTQEHFRQVRKHINAMGMFSDNPEIAYMFK